MNQLETFTLRRLSFGQLCIEGDCNMPPRAEATGDIDIDKQIVPIAKLAGVGPRDVVVDVGAFIGDTAWAMASELGAYVYAFEPFLDAYTCLLYNTRNLPVECINRPTGNGERVKMVYECPGPNFGMRSVVETTDPDCIVTARIDDLHLDSCKFMKIDCEGAEVKTLLGAAETIKKHKPFLLVEMYKEALEKRGSSPEELEQTLRGMGYELEMMGAPPRWDWLARPLSA